MLDALKHLALTPASPSTRGRPKNSGTWRDAADFEAGLRAAVQALRDEGRKPTQEAVAGVLCCDRRTLCRWLKDYDVSWQGILRR